MKLDLLIDAICVISIFAMVFFVVIIGNAIGGA